MEKKKKVYLKKIVGILLILLIIILVICFLVLNNENSELSNNEESDSFDESNLVENEILEEELQNETEVVEEETTWEWQHDTLENHNINSSEIDSVHSIIDQYPIYTEVIVKDGVIVDEYYKDGYNSESVFALQSVSKSITSAIFGIAIDQGYIDGVDTLVSEYFPEFLNDGSEYKSQITIWNLLTHTTGLNASDTADWDQWLASSNYVDYVLNKSALYRPGTVFSYFTGNTHLLSAIVQQTTGQTLYEYGKENLFDKLDMDSVECEPDPQGISNGGNGFAMNVYDMLKFGQLFLNNGVWEGEQIIPAQWVEESTSVQFERSSGTADYGYQWWVRTFGNNNHPAYFAQGHYGEYIFVVPDLELVVAITSYYEGSSSVYWQIMNNIVNACD